MGVIFIPNRTFLVRFGGISGEFGGATVRILARRSGGKIPMARLNEPDIAPKRTQKVRLVFTVRYPNSAQVPDHDIVGYQDNRVGF